MNKTGSVEWTSPPTSEQQVTDRLRRHILAGELPVGEFLSQRKLAELAGTSVISVRGALRQLENEGLIENVPRAGVRGRCGRCGLRRGGISCGMRRAGGGARAWVGPRCGWISGRVRRAIEWSSGRAVELVPVWPAGAVGSPAG
jgi:DNA-binding transcriptional MocR family regulator